MQMRRRAGNVLGQPATMGVRDEPIFPAMPDRHRDRDCAEVKSPIAHAREVIVEPAPNAVLERRSSAARKVLGELPGQDASVHL